MAIPVASPNALLVDTGYDGDHFRDTLLIRDTLPIIPPRPNCKASENSDYRHYRVERMFASSSSSGV
ncbi:hypothetical protein [Sphingomonas qomolangmaensis]|uniref:Transposase n=1 Tax=Sphingomonas qomolangmaensis TaxID=2918765 RepID=A0ABY5L7P7_9SPHN|nr:hypothetical protein [Sphingomonas qomolangmaensis]UUL81618.1 hypothetical protein NMP03_10445 [Sphingomonas qomolangmaensis]